MCYNSINYRYNDINILDNMCYISNVGDSRGVLSLNLGKQSESLSSDHKPNEEGEKKRIIDSGGKVYQ